MADSAAQTLAASKALPTARRLVEARQLAQPLNGFPGQIPADLLDAYACQDAAIGLWPDVIVGWKVGKVAPAFAADVEDARLVGPIFRRGLRLAQAGKETIFPVFVRGFAAVEGEFVFHLGRDAAPEKTTWSPAEATELVEALHIGIETAGSPLATINDLGPAVIISDFGNNDGLILGPAIANWREMVSGLACETFINDASVGKGRANLDDILDGLCFALQRNARRARPLKAGDYISTGAVTGVHDIRAGQAALVKFGAAGELRCRAVPAPAKV